MRKFEESKIELIWLLSFWLTLSGCTSIFEPITNNENLSDEDLYSMVELNMKNENWITAIKRLKEIELKYPYGKYSTQIQLDKIFAYYKNKEPELAITSADRFINTNPKHKSVDYAYYLKALALYEHHPSFFGKMMRKNSIMNRDMSQIYRSMETFKDLYTLFPDSQYVKDSKERENYLLNFLARHEISVAKYYYSLGATVAVVNRAKEVIENYSNTIYVELALAMLMNCYTIMGLEDLSIHSRSLLKLNFPDSIYLDRSVNDPSTNFQFEELKITTFEEFKLKKNERLIKQNM